MRAGTCLEGAQRDAARLAAKLAGDVPAAAADAAAHVDHLAGGGEHREGGATAWACAAPWLGALSSMWR